MIVAIEYELLFHLFVFSLPGVLTSSFLSNRHYSLCDQQHKVKAQADVQHQHSQPREDHHC